MTGMTDRTSHTHTGPTTTTAANMTSSDTSFRKFYAKTEHEHGNTQTQNSK